MLDRFDGRRIPLAHHLQHGVPSQLPSLTFGAGDDGGRAGGRIEQGHLSDRRAGTELGEHTVPATHLDAPAVEHEHRGPVCPLPEEGVTGLELQPHRSCEERLPITGVEVVEQRRHRRDLRQRAHGDSLRGPDATIAAMRSAALLALLLCLSASSAHAGDDDVRTKALDLVYEAADAIDSALAEAKGGREREAERLLTRAEEYLKRAEALAPGLARIAYERARLHDAEGEEEQAITTLEGALRGDLPSLEHLRAIELLDRLRAATGQEPVGASWRRSMTLRNVGGAAIGGGLALSLAGLGLAVGSFANDVYNGVTDAGIGANRAGWALCIAGAGVAGVGGGLVLTAQVRLDGLKTILPGPWRLPGGVHAPTTADRFAPSGFTLTLHFTQPPLPRR